MDSNTYIALIVAILSFLGTLIGAYLANRKTTALLSYRMDQIEKRVDELSSRIEKLGERYEK